MTALREMSMERVIRHWGFLVLGFFIILCIRGYYRRRKSWVDVPIVGASGILSSYWSALQFYIDGPSILEEGFRRHQGRPFKTAHFGHWRVFITSPREIEQFKNIEKDTLSAEIQDEEHLKGELTIGPHAVGESYALIVINQLTKRLAAVFPSVVDEMRLAFDENIPISPGNTTDWISVKMFTAGCKMITRTANRAFAGPTLCRDPEFVKIASTYAIDAFVGAKLLSLWPPFLRKFAANYLIKAASSRRKFTKLIEPLVSERNAMIEAGEELPNDMLTWLMQQTSENKRTALVLAQRLLFINVVAINTTSLFFLKVVFHVAAYPEYVEPLREEVSSATKEDGWTKNALGKCRKLDSFLKEVFRLSPIAYSNFDRQATRDFTLSSGTFIPKGTIISAAFPPMHRDRNLYGPNADKFDGFRWSRLREESEDQVTKHQTINVNSDWMTFGYGKHACPGRFFATNEIKIMLAHMIINYDVKFTDEKLASQHGQIPKDRWLGTLCIPDEKVEVSFRRRRRNNI